MNLLGNLKKKKKDTEKKKKRHKAQSIIRG